MRILYIDIDTLRPDHLGCYGYHRRTSPHIDRLAAEGTRFENCYVSDAPCLPSRAALYSGQCGIRNGAINHGGEAADYYLDPAERGFRTLTDNWIYQLRQRGYYTVTVSPFGERHSSFWFYNGFREMYNTGKGGGERADEVVPLALDWLGRRGREDHWYLHVNVWDPHTNYQVPLEQGFPFENTPAPAWFTEEVLKRNLETYGPGSGREPGGAYGDPGWQKLMRSLPRMAPEMDSMAAYKTWIDGYDTGIWYADQWVGKLLQKLESLGVLDDTLIMVSSDHGENQGELAVYGDHQTADHITSRVPMVIRHPKGVGGRGRVDRALHYQFDVAATLLELTGGKVPESWDGVGFGDAFRAERESGREALVVSNCAWACQRSVRWGDYLMIRSYHTGLKNYPEVMLFDVKNDPHELKDLAPTRPDLVGEGMRRLDAWWADEMRRSHRAEDPMWIVLREGGPFHARYGSETLAKYLARLRATGREAAAQDLERRAMELTVRWRR
jgi:arylsulfatase A-like enzyme